MRRLLSILCLLLPATFGAQGQGTVATVSNITALINRPSPSLSSPYVQVMGYRGAGDWGAQRLFYLTTNLAIGNTNDLGHTFPSQRRNAVWSSTDRTESFQDVRWFGADATGALDSTPAIQAALDHSSSGFGTNKMLAVKFPSGDFRMDTGIRMSQRAKILGTANDKFSNTSGSTNGTKGSVLHSYINNPGMDVIRVVADTDTMALTGFTIAGVTMTGSGRERDGIHVSGPEEGLFSVYGATVEDVFINNMGRHGLAFGSETKDSAPSWHYTLIRNVSTWGCLMDNFHLWNSHESSVGNVFDKLYSGLAGRNGCYIVGGGYQLREYTENTSAQLYPGAGLYLRNCRFAQVMKVTVEGSGRHDVSGYSTIPLQVGYGILAEGVRNTRFGNLHITTISGNYLNPTNVALVTFRPSQAADGYGQVESAGNTIENFTGSIYSFYLGQPSFAATNNVGSVTPGTHRFRTTASFDSGEGEWFSPVNGGLVYTTGIPWPGIDLTLPAVADLADSIAKKRRLYMTPAGVTNTWYLLKEWTLPSEVTNTIIYQVKISDFALTNGVTPAKLTPHFKFDATTDNIVIEHSVYGSTPVVIDDGVNNFFHHQFVDAESPNAQPFANTIKTYGISPSNWRVDAPAMKLGLLDIAGFAMKWNLTSNWVARVDFGDAFISAGGDHDGPLERKLGADKQLNFVMPMPNMDGFMGILTGDTSTNGIGVTIGGQSPVYTPQFLDVRIGTNANTMYGPVTFKVGRSGVGIWPRQELITPFGNMPNNPDGVALWVTNGTTQLERTSISASTNTFTHFAGFDVPPLGKTAELKAMSRSDVIALLGGVGGAFGIPEAPSDSLYYARRNAGWFNVALAFQPLDQDLTDLSAINGAASGDTIFRNATQWTRLAKGANGQILTLSGGFPAWAAAPSSGIADAPTDGTPYMRWKAGWTNGATVIDGVLASSPSITTPDITGGTVAEAVLYQPTLLLEPDRDATGTPISALDFQVTDTGLIGMEAPAKYKSGGSILTGLNAFYAKIAATNYFTGDSNMFSKAVYIGSTNVTAEFANKVAKTGDTMTGPLTLPAPLNITGSASSTLLQLNRSGGNSAIFSMYGNQFAITAPSGVIELHDNRNDMVTKNFGIVGEAFMNAGRQVSAISYSAFTNNTIVSFGNPFGTANDAVSRYDFYTGAAMSNVASRVMVLNPTTVDIKAPAGTLTYLSGFDADPTGATARSLKSVPVATFYGVGSILLPAKLFIASTTNGAVAGVIASPGANNLTLDCWDFDDTTQQSIQVSIPAPDDWDLGVMKAVVCWSQTTAVTGGNTYSVALGSAGNGDVTGATLGTAVTLTATVAATTNTLSTVTSGAITVGNAPQRHDSLTLRVDRLPADAGDTAFGKARLRWVKLVYSKLAPAPAMP